MNTLLVESTPTVSWKDYLELCKPRVVLLMVITSIVGMCLSSHAFVGWTVLLLGNLGIALAAASAAAVNHLADYRIDSKMARTQGRPVVQGKVSVVDTIIFASLLCVMSMAILVVFINTLTAVLTFLSIIGYAGVYTFYLKHNTSQNIVIGGLAGAAPPLLGVVAVTGHVTLMGLLLLSIIFVWTPPHFWALAIDRIEDYRNAEIPMLPNTHGIAYTKRCIVIYAAVLFFVSLLPYFLGCSDALYLFSAIILSGWFLWKTVQLYFDPDNTCAMQVFKVSISYLFLLFIALLVDHYIPLTLF